MTGCGGCISIQNLVCAPVGWISVRSLHVRRYSMTHTCVSLASCLSLTLSICPAHCPWRGNKIRESHFLSSYSSLPSSDGCWLHGLMASLLRSHCPTDRPTELQRERNVLLSLWPLKIDARPELPFQLMASVVRPRPGSVPSQSKPVRPYSVATWRQELCLQESEQKVAMPHSYDVSLKSAT